MKPDLGGLEAKLKKERRGVSKKDGAQSIKRAVEIIRAVAVKREKGVNLSSISKKLNLNIATTHRILSALVKEGFLTQFSRNYYLGIELFILGSMARQFNISSLFQSALIQLSQLTGHSVYLLMRSGLDSVCIGLSEGSSHIRIMNHNIGTRTPLGIGAGSLALMAFLEDKEVESILDANDRRYQSSYGLTAKDVQINVEQARKFGFALSEGVFKRGTTGVSLPIYCENGEIIASISVAGISTDMDEPRRIEIARLIKDEIAKVKLNK